MKNVKRILKALAVLAFWLLVWSAAARLTGRELLLPGPLSVLRRLAELCVSAQFWRTTAVSLLRILLGAAAALIAGTVLAVLTSRYALLRSLFSPLLTIIKSTPVASFIILALVWLGRDILPAFITLLMVLPVVWSNVSAGIAETDVRLLEMAKVFGFSPLKKLRTIYIPSVSPYFASACRSALGLGWKAGIAAEVLTVPSVSIGKNLYEAKLYLDTPGLFAWTLTVIICSLVIEKILVAGVVYLENRRGKGGNSHA